MEKSLLLNLHIGGEERKIRRAVVRGTEFWGLVKGERNINRREKHGLGGVKELEERIGLSKAKYLYVIALHFYINNIFRFEGSITLRFLL